ncbi:uncharacterized protein FJT64_017192 [Amphibalanus amphitrite]|uniref:Cortactin-binding protein-2 N-terminal domain-containing protein n=1 Tax=Amphibalanus amphitrite TaxID=1232801 RepID=A0A6A4XC70_AMPAM|nr:uncharacterized protein FJT64_017192 [Amphibalanus amphitrite]
MASKMSSNSPSNGGASTHGAIPKDTQAAMSSNDSGQNYEPPDIDPVTLKRNPKMELSKADLLKLLSCLEGELQARDVVIATLKVDEALIRSMADNQMASLENLILAQRAAQLKMAQYLRDAEARHAKAVQELEEEKAKHAHDTAQGDDVTYALEKERTRLKQELETERQAKKKVEKELKKTAETLEEERHRQKHMVLLLLAERKKVITKYIEERKRSEDLTQILSEEKGRAENMAEGLEEESKKSLQMEAELERHMSDCANQRQQLKHALATEEKRIRITCPYVHRYQDLLSEHEKLQRECDRLKNQLSEAHQVAMFQANSMAGGGGGGSGRYASGPTSPRPGGPATLPPQLPSKPAVSAGGVRPGTSTASTLTPPKVGVRRAVSPVGGPPPDDLTAMAANITKAVQPTATVSSQPVSAPMTGVAYGVQPGVALRNVQYGVAAAPQPTPAPPPTSASSPSASAGAPQVVRVTPRVSVTASPGTKVVTASQPGKVLFHVTTPAAGGAPPPNGAPPLALARKPPLGRGVPPPVPPNKPAVPPNKPGGGGGGGGGKASGLASRPEPAGQVGEGAAATEPLGPELANFQRMLVSMAGMHCSLVRSSPPHPTRCRRDGRPRSPVPLLRYLTE